MLPHRNRPTLATLSLATAIAGSASGQSDPGLFTTVIDIGPGMTAGDGDSTLGNSGPITPTFLTGDVLGSDSQLNLSAGGTILTNFSVGLLDGTGTNTELNVSGGFVESDLQANAGATVNFLGGDVGIVDANNGGIVNILGGDVSFIDVNGGGIVNITGGEVSLDVFAGGTLNVSGGNLSSSLDTFTGGALNISGGGFQLNGSPVTELTGEFGVSGSEEVLTGILADGTVFLFAEGSSTDFAADTVTLIEATVAPSANPGTLSSGTFGKGVRVGETLTVTGTGELLDNFAVVGGTLNFEGGTSRGEIAITSGVLNISGGLIDEIDALAGSTVNITGGEVGTSSDANFGSVFNISGGSIDGLDVNTGGIANLTGGSLGEDVVVEGTLNIAGGSVGTGLNIFDGVVNFSGGEIAEGLGVNEEGTFNVFGTAFFLDGVELNGLTLGEAFVITDRDVALTGVLADGSAFDFDLNSTFILSEDFFDVGATLTVTLVPEPTSLCPFALGTASLLRRRRHSHPA
ncbi:MAG: hypothetical protein AAF750_16895 [Planctomycetota bacterium]